MPVTPESIVSPQIQKASDKAYFDIEHIIDHTRHYFALFGLPLGYVLDHHQLRESYQKLMRQVHPDRFANNPAQQNQAVQIAAYINNAEQMLSDPISRAQYLLQLINHTNDQPHQHTLPMDFIETQIDWRERVENTPDPETMQQLMDNLETQINQARDDLNDQFTHWDNTITPPLTKEMATHIDQSIQKYQFWLKLHEAAEAKADRLLEN